jgi:glucokinase
MRHVIAGVDLGGTSIKAAIADMHGSLLAQDVAPTRSHDGPEMVLDRIGAMIDSLCRQSDATLISLGMGVPGLVDIETGVTRFLPNLPTQWRDVPVGETLSKRLNCPTRLLNDVRTATLAELRYGHGRSYKNVTFAFLSLGTGIGGGVVVDGRLRLGPLGAAGELGHQTILPEGPQCGCGNRGCLETVASGTAIAAEGIRLMRMGLAPKLYELVDGNADRVTTHQMAIAADTDESINNAITIAASYIGIASANIVATLHPEMIVLGGGVAEMGELLTRTVKNVITARVGMFPTEDIRVEQSQLGDKAGVMGAVALAIQTIDT